MWLMTDANRCKKPRRKQLKLRVELLRREAVCSRCAVDGTVEGTGEFGSDSRGKLLGDK